MGSIWTMNNVNNHKPLLDQSLCETKIVMALFQRKLGKCHIFSTFNFLSLPRRLSLLSTLSSSPSVVHSLILFHLNYLSLSIPFPPGGTAGIQ